MPFEHHIVRAAAALSLAVAGAGEPTELTDQVVQALVVRVDAGGGAQVGHGHVGEEVPVGVEVVRRAVEPHGPLLRPPAGTQQCSGAVGLLGEALKNTFDLIVNTVSAPIDMASYLGLLRLDGTLVSVGAPPQPLPVPVFALFGNRRSFAGSGIGSIAEKQEMLDFCAERGIAPEEEVIGADEVNEAYERVLRSDVRYRFVIDVDTLR